MFSRIFTDFYVQPMFQVYIEAIGLYLFWTVYIYFLKPEVKRIAGIIGLSISVSLILALTVLRRTSCNEISLVPFITFKNALKEPELYRTMFMNIILFLPFGLSLPFALPNNSKHIVLLTIIIGAVFSIAIEVCQFIFSLGRCETDDVIMNTLGAFIGGTSYLTVKMFKRFGSKKDNVSIF